VNQEANNQNSTPQIPNSSPSNQSSKYSDMKTVWIILGSCFGLLVVSAVLLYFMVFAGVNSARDRAKDAQIKSFVHQIRPEAEMYFDEHKTYSGFTLNVTLQNQIKSAGYSVVIQGLSDKTYIFYAELPNSGKIFCVDSAGFSGEIDQISSTKTSCK